MKGKVEVFAILADGSEELILSESNLVVNGAGESIVDMLTTPSSVLGISPRVMDTSNWRWGALSFGPAASSFQENAYFFQTRATETYGDASSLLDQISADHKLRILWVSGTIGAANGATASSYTPPYRLPSYPDTLDQKLEDASTAYAIASGDGTQSFGQFENRINFNNDDASSYFQGAYSPKSTLNALSGMLVSSYDGDFQADPSANMIVFDRVDEGRYNRNSQMDYRGFVSATYNARANVATSPHGYVCISGSVPNDVTGTTSQVTDARVAIYTQVGIGDMWAMNAYGGLHNIGLWSVDCKKSLLANEAPFLQDSAAYIDSDGTTQLEFKLFAKKTFTENLCKIKDSGAGAGFNNHKKLKIVWTIDFRAIHD